MTIYINCSNDLWKSEPRMGTSPQAFYHSYSEA